MSPAASPAPQTARRVPGRSGVSVSRALGSATRAGIFEHLQQAGAELTVRDIAGSFDLHPNVARTHLETLADAGLVSVGQRKHPGGGRPAKVYLAREDAPAPGGLDRPVEHGAGAALVVRLLTALIEDAPLRVPPGRTAAAVRAVRAQEVAAAEARKLVTPLVRSDRPGPPESSDEVVTITEAAAIVVEALGACAPALRVVKAGTEWVDLAGTEQPFRLLAETRPELAEALERGLLAGAFAAAGLPVGLAQAGSLPAARGEPPMRVWRARPAGASAARSAIDPSGTVDTRGLPREAGVVAAMRAITGLRRGDVLEVLAEGPGSPAAFARWADRAGHVLMGVERATDSAGRPAIRLLIRKGA
jgi:TusA-related sulfurtransferase/DNA-binding transcriptional ArsR family regulator